MKNKMEFKVKKAVKKDSPSLAIAKRTSLQNKDSPANRINHLQRTIGNQAVQKLFKSGTLQAKLEIGKPNDKYEKEADRVADIVMRMPEPYCPTCREGESIRRQPEEEEEEILQPKPVADQITPLVQRQEEEEEIQTKTIAEQITPLVQRQEEPEEEEEEPVLRQEEEPEEEEEEPIQPKPVAEHIMRMSDSICSSCEEEPVMRQEEEPEEEEKEPVMRQEEEPEEEEEEPILAKSNDSTTARISRSVESGISSLRGSGQPLSKSVRNYFEPKFGYDFSEVRVHTDSNAAETAKSINAKAFTKGKNIVFSSGQYNPGSTSGNLLLAHELTHVIQQSASPVLQKSVIQRQADLTGAPSGLPCILKTGPGHTAGVDILFSVGKDTISSTDKANLAAFAAAWVASGSHDTVFVDGYASTDGAQSTNWQLSCKRAETVKDELVRLGVSSGKIILIAHGESTEFSTSDQKENRRAVVSSLAEPSSSAIPPAVPPQPAPLSLKSIKFTSDHGMLKDNNADWADAGSVLEPEWITDPLRNKAVSQTKSTRLVAETTVNVGPPGTNFDLIGTSINNNDTSFKKTGITSTGADQVIAVTADADLPNVVSKLFRYIVWKIKTGGKEQLAGFSGPHRIYVTYSTPSGGVTEKRMTWSCEKADGENTQEKIADKIQAGVSSDTNFGGGGVDGWNLLAGGSGDCDNQARLMSYVVKLLGVTPANVKFVRASTNGGAGNCLNLETKWGLFSGTRYLILDFNVGPGRDWNAFEGTCETAGFYYAITPLIKANDDCDLLKKITCTQHWVKSPVPPGASGWNASNPSSAVPKP